MARKNKTKARFSQFPLGIFACLLAIFIAILFLIPNLTSTPKKTLPVQNRDLQAKIKTVNDKYYLSPQAQKIFSYKENGDRYTFQYPGYMSGAINDNSALIWVKTKKEIQDIYNEANTRDGNCTGRCREFIENKLFLDQQFIELNNMIHSYCKGDHSYDSKRFRLFDRGANYPERVEPIQLNSLKTCGVKSIEGDGYDASLINLYYRIVFIKGDYLGAISFPLLPSRTFRSVDDFLAASGYGSISDGQKEQEALQKFNYDGKLVKEVEAAYDSIVQTFELK